MDYNIEVDSEPGKGSVFTLTMSMGLSETSPKEAAERAVAAKCLSGLKSLVASSDGIARKALCGILADMGMSVASVDSIEDALGRVKSSDGEEGFDIVFVDGVILSGDWLEFVESFKRENASHKTLLCIISSVTAFNERRKIKELSGVVFVRKPVCPFRLQTLLFSSLKDFQGETEASIESGELLFNGKLVLVVEDNDISRKFVSRALKKFGCEVDEAANGKLAVDKMELGSVYDLVIMDCHMPLMDGFAATKSIREMETAGRHVKILAMTAMASEEDRLECLNAGMDDYISKPVRIKDIKDKLKSLLA
jgi:CheY-like chemotaxis protein